MRVSLIKRKKRESCTELIRMKMRRQKYNERYLILKNIEFEPLNEFL